MESNTAKMRAMELNQRDVDVILAIGRHNTPLVKDLSILTDRQIAIIALAEKKMKNGLTIPAEILNILVKVDSDDWKAFKRDRAVKLKVEAFQLEVVRRSRALARDDWIGHHYVIYDLLMLSGDPRLSRIFFYLEEAEPELFEHIKGSMMEPIAQANPYGDDVWGGFNRAINYISTIVAASLGNQQEARSIFNSESCSNFAASYFKRTYQQLVGIRNGSVARATEQNKAINKELYGSTDVPTVGVEEVLKAAGTIEVKLSASEAANPDKVVCENHPVYSGDVIGFRPGFILTSHYGELKESGQPISAEKWKERWSTRRAQRDSISINGVFIYQPDTKLPEESINLNPKSSLDHVGFFDGSRKFERFFQDMCSRGECETCRSNSLALFVESRSDLINHIELNCDDQGRLAKRGGSKFHSIRDVAAIAAMRASELSPHHSVLCLSLLQDGHECGPEIEWTRRLIDNIVKKEAVVMAGAKPSRSSKPSLVDNCLDVALANRLRTNLFSISKFLTNHIDRSMFVEINALSRYLKDEFPEEVLDWEQTKDLYSKYNQTVLQQHCVRFINDPLFFDDSEGWLKVRYKDLLSILDKYQNKPS